MWQWLNWFKPKPKPTPSPIENGWALSLLELTNDARQSRGIGTVALNDKLTTCAQQWAEWMAANRRLTHQSATSTLLSRVTKTGYYLSFGGENIAAGQTSPEIVHASWMKSPPHHENIMNSNFKDFGVGFKADANGIMYWCTVFGASQGKSLGSIHTPHGLLP